MDCPACSGKLSELNVQGLKVDVCRNGCGGVWFDNFELQKVDEQHESQGEVIEAITVASKTPVDENAKRNCPRDRNPMMRHFFSVKQQVQVDHCPKCAGYWLDLGELATIRSQFSTEEERKAAAKKHFQQLFGAELKALQAQGKEQAEQARKIARMFRFICPSYWIPGKQEGGAF